MRPTTYQVAFLLCLTAACAAAPDGDHAGAGRGGGVALQRGAQTFVGSAAFCTRPATIDAAVVAAATPEWREMQRDGVQDGSARHALLKSRMHERIVAACKRVAQAEGCDLVVRSGDIADNRGLPVVDLTAPLLRGL